MNFQKKLDSDNQYFNLEKILSYIDNDDGITDDIHISLIKQFIELFNDIVLNEKNVYKLWHKYMNKWTKKTNETNINKELIAENFNRQIISSNYKHNPSHDIIIHCEYEIKYIFKNYAFLSRGIPFIGNVCFYSMHKKNVYILVAKDSYIFRKNYKAKMMNDIIQRSLDEYGITIIDPMIKQSNVDGYKPKYGIMGGRCKNESLYKTISREFVEETMGLINQYCKEENVMEMIFTKDYWKKIIISASEDKQIITYLKYHPFTNDLFDQSYDQFNDFLLISLCEQLIKEIDEDIDFKYFHLDDIKDAVIYSSIGSLIYNDFIIKWSVLNSNLKHIKAVFKDYHVIVDLSLLGLNEAMIKQFHTRCSICNYQRQFVKHHNLHLNSFVLYNDVYHTYSIEKSFIEKSKLGWIRLSKMMEWLINDLKNNYHQNDKTHIYGFINSSFIPTLIIIYKLLFNRQTDNISFTSKLLNDPQYNVSENLTFFYSIESGNAAKNI